LLTSIEREGRYLVPRGDTRFQAKDKIRGFARLSNVPELNRIFGFGKDVVRVMKV
jgi:Trk K+ transport system NAD-binding subunit